MELESGALVSSFLYRKSLAIYFLQFILRLNLLKINVLICQVFQCSLSRSLWFGRTSRNPRRSHCEFDWWKINSPCLVSFSAVSRATWNVAIKTISFKFVSIKRQAYKLYHILEQVDFLKWFPDYHIDSTDFDDPLAFRSKQIKPSQRFFSDFFYAGNNYWKLFLIKKVDSRSWFLKNWTTVTENRSLIDENIERLSIPFSSQSLSRSFIKSQYFGFNSDWLCLLRLTSL